MAGWPLPPTSGDPSFVAIGWARDRIVDFGEGLRDWWSRAQKDWYRQARSTQQLAFSSSSDSWKNVIQYGIVGSQFAEQGLYLAPVAGVADVVAVAVGFGVGCYIGWKTPPTPP